MKLIVFVLLAFIVVVIRADPVKISDNNVGDIVTVGINANAVLSNEMNQNILSIIVGILNQQAIVALPGEVPAEAVK